MCERGFVENIVAVLLLSEVGIVFYGRICTPPFLMNWGLQWKTAVPHTMKGLNIYIATVSDILNYISQV